jgi:hypothetical protein
MTFEEKQAYWREEIEKLNARILASMTPEGAEEWNAPKVLIEAACV